MNVRMRGEHRHGARYPDGCGFATRPRCLPRKDGSRCSGRDAPGRGPGSPRRGANGPICLEHWKAVQPFARSTLMSDAWPSRWPVDRLHSLGGPKMRSGRLCTEGHYLTLQRHLHGKYFRSPIHSIIGSARQSSPPTGAYRSSSGSWRSPAPDGRGGCSVRYRGSPEASRWAWIRRGRAERRMRAWHAGVPRAANPSRSELSRRPGRFVPDEIPAGGAGAPGSVLRERPVCSVHTSDRHHPCPASIT